MTTMVHDYQYGKLCSAFMYDSYITFQLFPLKNEATAFPYKKIYPIFPKPGDL